MITFSKIKEKVHETYKDRTVGFRYGVIVFYSLFSEALISFVNQLGQLESLDGITKEDRHALILWVQNEIQKKILVAVGIPTTEVDEDILETQILFSGRELTEQ